MKITDNMFKFWNSNQDEKLSKEEKEFLFKKYGCGSIPLGDMFPPKTQEQIDKENAQVIDDKTGMTYGEWSGRTGTGKLLKDKIKKRSR